MTYQNAKIGSNHIKSEIAANIVGSQYLNGESQSHFLFNGYFDEGRGQFLESFFAQSDCNQIELATEKDYLFTYR